MLERPPKEPEALSWAYAVAWTLFVFVSIPFVRSIVGFVRDTWGRELFTYIVAAAIVVAAVLSVVLLRRLKHAGTANYVWLAGVAAVFLYYTWQLKNNPEEAVHFIEYGVLSVLVYRALTHRIGDYSIYVAAALIVTTFGILDEAIQWLVPGRFWDYRDVWLNISAGALVLVGLAMGIRPPLISGRPDGKSVRRLFRLALIPAVILALSYLNTPSRVALYADLIQVPGVIQVTGDKMAEYGHLYSTPQTGTFRSRLSLEELRAADREQAEATAAVLDQYPDREAYRDFHKLYPATRDPFLHETRVHIFRRDVYLQRADEAAADSSEQTTYLAVAHWENQILETHFGETLKASRYLWTPETRARVAEGADLSAAYVSPVSQNLITELDERQVLGLFAALIAILLFGAFYRRAKPA